MNNELPPMKSREENHLPPGVSILPETDGPIVLYSHHPITGQPAADIRPEAAQLSFTQRRKAEKEFAAMRKAGALFYWSSMGGVYSRLSLTSMAAVMKIKGKEMRLVHNWPDDMADLQARADASIAGRA